MKQRTLAMMTGFERYSKKTRRAQFLDEMEQVVPCIASDPTRRSHFFRLLHHSTSANRHPSNWDQCTLFTFAARHT